MLKKNIKKALSEVYILLNNMKKEDKEKLPSELIDFIKENMDSQYTPVFDDLPIKDLNLLPETKGILGFCYAKYWAKDEDDKEFFIKLLKENEFKNQ